MKEKELYDGCIFKDKNTNQTWHYVNNQGQGEGFTTMEGGWVEIINDHQGKYYWDDNGEAHFI